MHGVQRPRAELSVSTCASSVSERRTMEFGLESSCALVFTVLCVVLAYIYRLRCKSYTYFDKLGISGPVPSTLCGTWTESLHKFIGDVDVANAKLYGRVYGTYDGTVPNLMAVEPDMVKEIVFASPDKFQDRRVAVCQNPIVKETLKYFFGDDIEKQFEVAEAHTAKVFPRLESSANALVRNIAKNAKEGPLNLTSCVSDYIYDVIAMVIFGIDLNADIAFKDAFVGHCQRLLTIDKPNSRQTLIPLLYENIQRDSWIFPPKSLDYFRDLIASGIKETPGGEAVTEGKAANLIEVLVKVCEERNNALKEEKGEDGSEDRLTDDYITIKCLSTILALINTARTIIVATLYTLASQQEVQEELSKEIEKNKSEKLSRWVVQDLPFMNLVIAEILRLYPTQFRLEKICKEAVTVGKYNLESGSRVSIPLYALHRQEEFYPEPEKFDPMRFSQEAIENRKSFAYLPFGKASVHRTNDVDLSLLAAKVTLFKLVENFKFKKNGDDASKALFKSGITGVPVPRSLNVDVEAKK